MRLTTFSHGNIMPMIAVPFAHLNCQITLRGQGSREDKKIKTLLLSSNKLQLSYVYHITHDQQLQPGKPSDKMWLVFRQMFCLSNYSFKLSSFLIQFWCFDIKLWTITVIRHVVMMVFSAGGRNPCSVDWGLLPCVCTHVSLRAWVCGCVCELSDLNSYHRTKRLAIAS